MRIIVIGSGFGGLAAAIRLQRAGHQVTMVEKRDQLGGRAYVYRQDGFTFDGGPTVITAPWLIEELFSEAGRKPADYLEMVPVDPFYRIFFPDGSTFEYTGDAERMLEQIRKFNPADVAGYEKFLAKTADIFKTGFGLIDTPFLTPGSMLRVLPDLARLRADRSVYSYVSRYIADERLRQVFSFHPLLVGGNPFQTTSIYTLILFLEREWGVWFAKGGTGAVVTSLGRLFTELGGETMLDCEIETILVDGVARRATGVRLKDGSEISSDAVVSNADVAWTYRHMLPAKHRRKYTDRKLEKMKYSMSLFVHYFGTDRRYDDIPHHSIILGERYQGLLEDIFDRHHLADDFSLYLHRPTATDPSLAPEGGDAFYVLSPVPHLASGDDWSVIGRAYRDRIVAFLEERYLPDLSKHIVSEHWIDPQHFQETLNSFHGSAFSVAPILTQSAYFRPHNRSEELSNLYFVGAGTHPGAGLPGVLSSAKIVAGLIGESHGKPDPAA